MTNKKANGSSSTKGTDLTALFENMLVKDSEK